LCQRISLLGITSSPQIETAQMCLMGTRAVLRIK
jgi:hypothetical protein